MITVSARVRYSEPRQTWLYFGYANGRVNKLSEQGHIERMHSKLSSTINTASRVSLAASYRTNVDDVTTLALLEIYNRGYFE